MKISTSLKKTKLKLLIRNRVVDSTSLCICTFTTFPSATTQLKQQDTTECNNCSQVKHSFLKSEHKNAKRCEINNVILALWLKPSHEHVCHRVISSPPQRVVEEMVSWTHGAKQEVEHGQPETVFITRQSCAPKRTHHTLLQPSAALSRPCAITHPFPGESMLALCVYVCVCMCTYINKSQQGL